MRVCVRLFIDSNHTLGIHGSMSSGKESSGVVARNYNTILIHFMMALMECHFKTYFQDKLEYLAYSFECISNLVQDFLFWLVTHHKALASFWPSLWNGVSHQKYK
jgi:hypothetical protein